MNCLESPLVFTSLSAKDEMTSCFKTIFFGDDVVDGNEQSRFDRFIKINHKIRAPEVRVIDFDGTQLGIMPTPAAIKRAAEQGLDLVEISPYANPPVCKILDHRKYTYTETPKP